MVSWSLKSNHWMLRSTQLSSNFPSNLTPSILILQTWNTYHPNPLDKTNLMASRSLKSNHWMLRSTMVSLNFPWNLTPSILMLQIWNTYHPNPLDETNLMVSRSLKSNHWMLRSTKLKIICLLIIVKNFDFIVTFIYIIWVLLNLIRFSFN